LASEKRQQVEIICFYAQASFFIFHFSFCGGEIFYDLVYI